MRLNTKQRYSKQNCVWTTSALRGDVLRVRRGGFLSKDRGRPTTAN